MLTLRGISVRNLLIARLISRRILVRRKRLLLITLIHQHQAFALLHKSVLSHRTGSPSLSSPRTPHPDPSDEPTDDETDEAHEQTDRDASDDGNEHGNETAHEGTGEMVVVRVMTVVVAVVATVPWLHVVRTSVWWMRVLSMRWEMREWWLDMRRYTAVRWAHVATRRSHAHPAGTGPPMPQACDLGLKHVLELAHRCW